MGLVRAIDWRLVGALALPVWAFVVGLIVAHNPSLPPRTDTPVEAAAILSPPAAPVETIPAPREVVSRTEYVSVPIAVPIPGESISPIATPLEPAAEFKLPASEVIPSDRCKTYDTKIRFHPDLTAAAEETKSSKKMLLVLHISGHFDDPGFT
jgi:hypothetical protein